MALRLTPIRGLTFAYSKKIVLIYFQSVLIAIQEEIPINICTVSNNKQEELIVNGNFDKVSSVNSEKNWHSLMSLTTPRGRGFLHYESMTTGIQTVSQCHSEALAEESLLLSKSL